MFNRIVDVREENDYTQKKIAEILKISGASVSQWEHEKEIISLIKLNEFANYFDVSLDYLAGFTDIKNYKNSRKILDKSLIGKRVREVRKNNGLTVRDLAGILNTSSSTISGYETGKTLILTSFAYEIAKRYNVSLDWLCGKID